jgi:hypothetical protein
VRVSGFDGPSADHWEDRRLGQECDDLKLKIPINVQVRWVIGVYQTTSDTAMSLPPFPEDIPTHPLIVIDYQKLLEDDAVEIEKLWQAATTLGFW